MFAIVSRRRPDGGRVGRGLVAGRASGLDNLVFLYDDNHVSIDGDTELAFTEDRAARYDAYGWNTSTVLDGNDLDELDAAISRGDRAPGPAELRRR